MAQIINGTGDIKVMNDKGETKWFCKRIVEDKQLMKSMKYEVVEAPDSFPPIDIIEPVADAPVTLDEIDEPAVKRPYKSRK